MSEPANDTPAEVNPAFPSQQEAPAPPPVDSPAQPNTAEVASGSAASAPPAPTPQEPTAAESAETAEQRISSLPARAEDAAARLKESNSKRVKLNGDESASPPTTVAPSVEVDNSSVLESVSHLPERMLGTQVYEPGKLLLREYDDYWNSIVQVRLARRFISKNHDLVRRRAVWGTSIYTDDSDLVAALYHEGYFEPDSKLDEASDLLVSVRVLPPLRKYTGSTQHGLNSRTWLSPHDGTSYIITDVQEIAQGSAEAPLSGRRQRAQAWGEAYAQARPASQRPSPHPAEA